MSASSRASNLLKASILSDAATMPLHWIYNQADITTKVGGSSAIFFDPPSCPYYSHPAGAVSPYGAEALPYIKSVAVVGSLDRDHVSQAIFDSLSTYPDAAVNGYAGYLNHVPKQFIANRNAGKSWVDCSIEDSHAQGISKAPIVVARYAGSPELSQKMEEMVGILQRSSLSVEASILSGKLLERILFKRESPAEALHSLLADAELVHLTSWQRAVLSFVTSDTQLLEWQRFTRALAGIPLSPEDAYRNMRICGGVLKHVLSSPSIAEALETAPLDAKDRAVVNDAIKALGSVDVASLSLDTKTVAQSLGLSCNLPGVLLVSFYIMLKSSSLREAVETNILVGGDNCSRAMLVGAAFGALEEVPVEWTEKVQESWWTSTAQAIDQIVARNPLLG